MIINLFNNFFEIIFWFASSYFYFSTDINSSNNSILETLYNSFCIMTTFGVSNLKMKTEFGMLVMWFQSITGLFMSILSISRFIGILPKVDSMDDF